MATRLNGNLKIIGVTAGLVVQLLVFGTIYGRLAERTEQMSRTLNKIEERLHTIETVGIDDRYRKSDAAQDFGEVSRKIERLEDAFDKHVRDNS